MLYALYGTAFKQLLHLLHAVFTLVFWFSKGVSKNTCKLDDSHKKVQTDLRRLQTESKEDCIFQMSKITHLVLCVHLNEDAVCF